MLMVVAVIDGAVVVTMIVMVVVLVTFPFL